MFHPCQNPSVYVDPEGKLRMLANTGSNGIWESDSVDGNWRCIRPGFPPGGDCTFFFRWGRFDYIIGGFTGLWSKPVDGPDSVYKDVVLKGLDFYDGSNVPSITEITGGRFIMASWIPITSWGGNLVMRELIQFPNGRIGSKWMKEITPETEQPITLAARVAETTTFPIDSKSFMLLFDIQPAEVKKGRFSISFLPENGEQASCELQINLADLRGQFGPGSLNNFAGNEKSLREGGMPSSVGNYAIENLIGIDKPFTVRLIIKGCDKIGGSLVDAEIAGQRTMISYRPDLTVKKMVFRTEGVELKNIQVALLKNQENR
jgi:beta-fructofuranosidase